MKRLVGLLVLALVLPKVGGAVESPWNIKLSKYSSISDKVALKRIETTKESGYYYIRGEVINNTLYEIYLVRMNMSFKDSTGSIRLQDHTYAYGEDLIQVINDIYTEMIKPGKTGFFETELRSDDVPANIKTYSISVEFGKSSPTLRGDINNDGTVDFTDFFILADNFGKTSVAPSAKLVSTTSDQEQKIQMLEYQLKERRK